MSLYSFFAHATHSFLFVLLTFITKETQAYA